MFDPVGFALLSVLFIAFGFLIGRRAPLVGFAVFLCFLGVTSSLPWQLGFANVTPSLTYLCGLLLGARPNTAGSAEPRGLGVLALFVMASSAAVGVAASMPPLRLLTVDRGVLLLSDLLRFDPDGTSAISRAALVSLVGPALFVVALPLLASRAAQDRMRSCVALSLAAALAGVAFQFAWLDPYVRPDMDRSDGAFVTGVVGLFQDPHSFAAYLVLALGCVVGIAVANRLHGARSSFWLHAGLATIAGVVLLATRSRSGLVATLVAASTFAALLAARRASKQRGTPVNLAPYLSAVPAVLGLIAAVLVLTPLRAIPRGVLDALGEDRAAALFDDSAAPLELASSRLTSWTTAVVLIRDQPLWGVGPRGFVSAAVEPEAFPVVAPEPTQRRRRFAPAGAVRRQEAHNYYLQIGAELGLPTLICFLWLVGSAFHRTAIGVVRSQDDAHSMVLAGIAAGESGFLGQCLVSHPLLIAELQGFFWIVAALGVAMASSGLPSREPAHG